MSSLTEEEIFDKSINDVIETPKKPKRKLTEKQLENLKKGREKMALKRAKDKEAKAKLEKAKKEDLNGAKEHQEIKKKNVRKKRDTLKELNKKKELEILQNLEKKEKDRSNRWELYEGLKVKCLEKATSVKEFNEIKDALSGINDNILDDNALLKEYCKKVMKPYISKKI